MISPDTLFLETFNDLKSKLTSNKEYDILKAAGLLRQLLLDGRESLVMQVNRKHKLQIRFKILGNAPDATPDILKQIMTFCWRSPYADAGDAHHFLNLDKFLAYSILTVEQRDITVREIITVSANVFGGVHIATKLTDDEQKLIDAFKFLLIK